MPDAQSILLVNAYEYLCAIALRSLYAYSLRNCKYEFLTFRPNPMFDGNMGLGRNKGMGGNH